MTTIKLQIGDWQQTYVLALTDAPTNFDGFGTFTIQEYGWPIEPLTRQDARLVLIPEEHLDWQTARNSSGLHPTWTLTPDFDFEQCIPAVQEILGKRLSGKENVI